MELSFKWLQIGSRSSPQTEIWNTRAPLINLLNSKLCDIYPAILSSQDSPESFQICTTLRDEALIKGETSQRASCFGGISSEPGEAVGYT